MDMVWMAKESQRSFCLWRQNRHCLLNCKDSFFAVVFSALFIVQCCFFFTPGVHHHRASFCCSKKVRKLHLFSKKVTFIRTFDCERLDTTYFCLQGLGQKPRFSALPPPIEFGHCCAWLGL